MPLIYGSVVILGSYAKKRIKGFYLVAYGVMLMIDRVCVNFIVILRHFELSFYQSDGFVCQAHKEEFFR